VGYGEWNNDAMGGSKGEIRGVSGELEVGAMIIVRRVVKGCIARWARPGE